MFWPGGELPTLTGCIFRRSWTWLFFSESQGPGMNASDVRNPDWGNWLIKRGLRYVILFHRPSTTNRWGDKKGTGQLFFCNPHHHQFSPEGRERSFPAQSWPEQLLWIICRRWIMTFCFGVFVRNMLPLEFECGGERGGGEWEVK